MNSRTVFLKIRVLSVKVQKLFTVLYLFFLASPVVNGATINTGTVPSQTRTCGVFDSVSTDGFPVPFDSQENIKRFWRRRPISGYSNFKREPLDPQVFKDLEVSGLILTLETNFSGGFLDPIKTFMYETRMSRLKNEFSNPLIDASEINEGLKDVSELATFPELLNQLREFYLALSDFNSTPVARALSFEIKNTGHDYFSTAFDIPWTGEELVSRLDRVMRSLPSSLVLYFAHEDFLKGEIEDGYLAGSKYIESRQKLMEKAKIVLATLKKMNRPVFKTIARVFESFLNPQLLDPPAPPAQAAASNSWTTLWKKPAEVKRSRKNDAALAAVRLSLVSNMYLAIEELDLLAYLAALMIENSAFKIPRAVNSQSGYLKIVRGHEPAIFRRLKSSSVPNSVLLGAETPYDAQILAGPNQSGKSVYLYMVGRNLLLGSVRAPVLADEMIFSPIKLMSSFHVPYDRGQGQSQFSAQAALDAKWLQQIETSRPSILIGDEFNFGTSPRQAREINRETTIWFIERGNLVIIQSQDPELQSEPLRRVQMIHNNARYEILPDPTPEEDANAPDVLLREGAPLEYVNRIRRRLGLPPLRQ